MSNKPIKILNTAEVPIQDASLSLIQKTQVMTCDPSAIGLFGLAMVTLVASSSKLGWTTGTALVIPWAIFLGGFAQLFASVKDAQKGNLFGATAFAGYGFFWLAMAMSWLTTAGVFGESLAQAADPSQFGFAFIGYLIFSLFMTIGAVETNKMLFYIFVLIDLLFLSLSISTLTGSHLWHMIAGYDEFLISMVGFYGFAGNVLNKHFNKEFFAPWKAFRYF